MKPSRRRTKEDELATLARQREQKRGELEEMAERYQQRAQLGKAATEKLLLRIEEMRAEYLAIRQRYEKRKANAPTPSPEAADF